MTALIIEVNQDNFAGHIGPTSGLVLVDIWAEWCGPCRYLSAILNEVAEIYAGEIQILKVNADENQAITDQYQPRGLPTMVLLRNGVEQERILGLVSKTRITQVLDQYV
jgi:thioredoxin 1